MNSTIDVKKSGASNYRTLRTLFIIGYAINIALWFVPEYRVNKSVLTLFSLVRSISQVSPGWTMFYVLVFASNIVFIILALASPRRWIFLTASSVAAFFLLYGLFSGSNEQIEYLLIPRILGYIAALITLTGFLIRPPATETKQE